MIMDLNRDNPISTVKLSQNKTESLLIIVF